MTVPWKESALPENTQKVGKFCHHDSYSTDMSSNFPLHPYQGNKRRARSIFKFICLRISTWSALPWCNQEGTMWMRFQIDNCFLNLKQNITIWSLFQRSPGFHAQHFRQRAGWHQARLIPQSGFQIPQLRQVLSSPSPLSRWNLPHVSNMKNNNHVIFLLKVDGLVVSKTKVFQSSLGSSGKMVSVQYIFRCAVKSFWICYFGGIVSEQYWLVTDKVFEAFKQHWFVTVKLSFIW